MPDEEHIVLCGLCGVKLVRSDEAGRILATRGIKAIYLCWTCSKVAASNVNPSATVEVEFAQGAKDQMRHRQRVRDDVSDLLHRMKNRKP